MLNRSDDAVTSDGRALFSPKKINAIRSQTPTSSCVAVTGRSRQSEAASNSLASSLTSSMALSDSQMDLSSLNSSQMPIKSRLFKLKECRRQQSFRRDRLRPPPLQALSISPSNTPQMTHRGPHPSDSWCEISPNNQNGNTKNNVNCPNDRKIPTTVSPCSCTSTLALTSVCFKDTRNQKNCSRNDNKDQTVSETEQNLLSEKENIYHSGPPKISSSKVIVTEDFSLLVEDDDGNTFCISRDGTTISAHRAKRFSVSLDCSGFSNSGRQTQSFISPHESTGIIHRTKESLQNRFLTNCIEENYSDICANDFQGAIPRVIKRDPLSHCTPLLNSFSAQEPEIPKLRHIEEWTKKEKRQCRSDIRFEDLQIGLKLGSGRQGCVRCATHLPTATEYALKSVTFHDNIHFSPGTHAQTPSVTYEHITRNMSPHPLPRSVSPAYAECVDNSFVEGIKSLRMELQRLQEEPHPNIVATYDAYFRDGSVVYLLMEHMDAGSCDGIMKGLLKRRKEIDGNSSTTVNSQAWPERFLSFVASQVLTALSHLHNPSETEKCIIHRDIKPSNILLSRTGRVKIADFGSSFCGQGTAWVEDPDLCVGSVPYMPPERLLGEKYCCNCDIWSLGVTLCELSIGSYPFGGRSVKRNHFAVRELVAAASSTLKESDQCNLSDCSKAIHPGIRWDLYAYGGHQDAGHASDAFVSFIRACLRPVDSRPSAASLLKHTFITEFNPASDSSDSTFAQVQKDFAEWISAFF